MSEFRCIAIETSTNHGSVAACNGSKIVSHKLDDSATSSRQVFGIVAALLDDLNITPAQLDCVAFGCGPGSFTGVRVAASATQGIAFARQLPVCPVSSLEALAANAAGSAGDGTLLACLDARMGEAYVGGYHCEQGRVTSRVLDDCLIDPNVWTVPESLGEVTAIGPGWTQFNSLFAGREHGSVTDVWPDAVSALDLARDKFAAGAVVSAVEALPNYIRNNVTQ